MYVVSFVYVVIIGTVRVGRAKKRVADWVNEVDRFGFPVFRHRETARAKMQPAAK